MTRVESLPLQPAHTHAGVALLGIGTATPPAVSQERVTALAEELAGASNENSAWLKRIFSRSGVNARGSVLITPRGDPIQQLRSFYPHPASDVDRGPTTAARMIQYALHAPPLAALAANRALAESEISPHSITHLITVSCTGFSAPGLDVELIQRLSLHPSVQRLHIGFMGCHAAFNALAAARSIVLANPDALVLVCCVELCSLHFAYGWTPDKLIANALFGDGAAAAIVGAHTPQLSDDDNGAHWKLLHSESLHLPNSRDAMTWRIGDHGFEMTLAAELPSLIQKQLKPWCARWLADCDLELADIQSWAVHPGGPKILSAAANSLDIPPDSLRFSRSILAQHGNMSSTTILFILQQMAAEEVVSPCVALGFGPGLMMEGMLLTRS